MAPPRTISLIFGVACKPPSGRRVNSIFSSAQPADNGLSDCLLDPIGLKPLILLMHVCEFVLPQSAGYVHSTAFTVGSVDHPMELSDSKQAIRKVWSSWRASEMSRCAMPISCNSFTAENLGLSEVPSHGHP